MITGRGYTLLPLQGEVFPVVLGYPGCRFACPGLSARWAFSPLHLMTPGYLILHIKLDTLVFYPVVDDCFAHGSEYTLGVVLYASDVVVLMAERHDVAFVRQAGGNDACGQPLGVDNP